MIRFIVVSAFLVQVMPAPTYTSPCQNLCSCLQNYLESRVEELMRIKRLNSLAASTEGQEDAKKVKTEIRPNEVYETVPPTTDADVEDAIKVENKTRTNDDNASVPPATVANVEDTKKVEDEIRTDECEDGYEEEPANGKTINDASVQPLSGEPSASSDLENQESNSTSKIDDEGQSLPESNKNIESPEDQQNHPDNWDCATLIQALSKKCFDQAKQAEAQRDADLKPGQVTNETETKVNSPQSSNSTVPEESQGVIANGSENTAEQPNSVHWSDIIGMQLLVKGSKDAYSFTCTPKQQE